MEMSELNTNSVIPGSVESIETNLNDDNSTNNPARADRERIRQALASNITSSTESFPGARRPIPVSTVEWQSTNLSQMMPMHGIDFLGGVEQVYIQQTVNYDDLLANQTSENLYSVKVPHGETLYLASETSKSCHRTFFGANRAFTLRLYDHTRQQAMEFRRRLACNCCLIGCYLQKLEVWTPPGNVLGTVEQNWTVFAPTFTIRNEVGNAIYQIEGPNMCTCAMYKEADFKILSPDRSTCLGTISHQWDQFLVGYNTSIIFPGRTLDCKDKALILGAAFLLEYMFFVKGRSCVNC